MADDQTLGSRARKYYEGWMYHQPTNGKDWTKYWMVLRGNMLFIFQSDRPGKDGVNSMKGTLTLGPDTELKNLAPDSKKKGFKFELTTTSNNNERKVNRFKFDKENERDLWKAFIVGIAVGIVPSDVHLLPGQLKDVHEAIGDLRIRPPPLPDTTIPRPRIAAHGGMNRSASSDQLLDHAPYPHYGRDDAGSDDSGSFRGHVTQKYQRSSSLTGAEHGIQSLRDLKNRQHDITTREIQTVKPADIPRWSADHAPDPLSPALPTPPFPTPPPPIAPMSPASNGNVFFGKERFQSTSESEPSYPTWNTQKSNSHQSSVISTSPTDKFSYNNNETHIFYKDPDRNRTPPSWFFVVNNESRLVAEQILTMGRRYGNVLMRTSTSFGSSGKYVISMRREVAGGTKLDHYEVVKMHGGYKINVDNKHSPMYCLSEVMDFFVSVAGPGTNPMKSNDVDKILNRVPDPSYPTEPPLSPTSPSSGGFSHKTLPSNGWGGTHLRDRDVDQFSPSTLGHPSLGRTSTNSSIPSEIAPGIPNWEQSIHYANITSSGSRGSSDEPHIGAAVPPRHMPSQTLQRTGDYSTMQHRMDSLSVNDHGPYGQHNQLGGPPAPPPAPTPYREPASSHYGGIQPSQSQYGGPPPAPPMPPSFGAAPPPAPPAPPAAPPLAPDWQSRQFSTTRPTPSTPQHTTHGYNTTPHKQEQPSGGSPHIQSIQDELMRKVLKRKEAIYGTAQIVTNY